MNKFRKDFKTGKKAEQLVTKLFEAAGFTVTANESTDKKELIGWDLCLTKDDICVKVEVKYDVMAAKTGNVAVEYFNHKKGEPSGILATKADYWIYVFGKDDYWIVEVSVLKKFLNNERGRMVSGGDNNSQMILYKKDRVLGPVFKKLNDAEF